MQDFSAPILQQPRLVMVLPVVIIAATVVAANLVWFLVRSFGVPPTVSGIAALVTFIAGIAFAISSSLGPQGTIRVELGQLVVDGRWRGPRTVQLERAEMRPLVWHRGGVTTLVVGVILDVRGANSSVTIGSSDPGLADVLTRSGVESTTVPPRATLAPEHFRQLMDVLGLEPAAGEAR